MKTPLLFAAAFALLATHTQASSELPNWATLCARHATQESLNRSFNITDAQGKLRYGFDLGAFSHTDGAQASVVLETQTAAYFFSEISDIWQAFYRCDKSTGTLTLYQEAHHLDCAQLPLDELTGSQLLYKDCSAK